ncbi:phosphotransferase [Cellulomonas sp. PhB143]|uniref:phosphotransferase n=1 Tax=Cellulomonas sp. PhB143 TaxID=2485186 RepID=UPI000F49BCAC|nr:phosphotransferase [Cellulomonas sp. PhB143]ROS78433.1 phosphotransferase family enzyme [Cellulomonas sp. PhB143]
MHHPDDVPITSQIPRAEVRAKIDGARLGSARIVNPPAIGRRPWASVPRDVRAEIDAINGSPVVAEQLARPGFSGGIASTVTLASGRRMFLKAASVVEEPFAADLHRAEAETAVRLPEAVPAPEFLWTYADDEWIVLAYEVVAGDHPTTPWGRYALARALAAIDDLSRVPGARDLQLRPTGPDLASMCSGWAALDAEPDAFGEGLARIAPWATGRLHQLAEIEKGVLVASEGEALVHGDLRADTMLLAHGDMYLLDWPYASRGAPWLDLALFLPTIGMQGIATELDPVDAASSPEERKATGVELARMFAAHPLGGTVHPADLRAVVAGVAGYLISSALQPASPGVPGLRDVQSAQGVAAIAWLEQLGI